MLPATAMLRGGILATVSFGVIAALSAVANSAAAYDGRVQMVQLEGADTLVGAWVTQRTRDGELIRIDFQANGTYRRIYQLSRTDFTNEVGRFAIQSNGSILLYDIRWNNPTPPNRQE